MQLTLTAEWTSASDTAERLAIAGYTAVIEMKIMGYADSRKPVYEYTVLRDHIEIVAVGHRTDPFSAQIVVEEIIAKHAAALSL